MSGKSKKNADKYIPYCSDQGIPCLAGAAKPGVSIQMLANWAMPNGGVLNFANNGLANMDISNGSYAVIIQNQTDPADEATVAANAKLSTQLTVVGPDENDVLDIIIVGTLKGQLS